MDSDQQPTRPQVAQPFKNRRGGLIAFGVFQFLIAAVMFLFAVMVLLIPTAEIAKAQPAGSPQVSFALVSVFYGVIGAVFATLGIGSILAKNWARIGTLIVCWLWLGIGLISILMTALVMPAILKNAAHAQQNLPANFDHSVIIVSLVMLGIVFVLLPSIFLIFYHSKNVKATCLADQDTSDAAKRPVLMTVLIFLFGLSLLSLPFAIFTKYPVVLFGHVFWGWLGKIFFSVSIAAELFAMWAYIRRDIRGWWVAFIASAFWICSSLVTFAGGDLIELYKRMGMSEEQLAIFRTPHFLPGFLAILFCVMAARLGAIVYSKRYFPQTRAT